MYLSTEFVPGYSSGSEATATECRTMMSWKNVVKLRAQSSTVPLASEVEPE